MSALRSPVLLFLLVGAASLAGSEGEPRGGRPFEPDVPPGSRYALESAGASLRASPTWLRSLFAGGPTHPGMLDVRSAPRAGAEDDADDVELEAR